MKKLLSTIVILSITVACFINISMLPVNAENSEVLYYNGFESGDLSEWKGISFDNCSISDTEKYKGNYSLSKRPTASFDSPYINLYQRIKNAGAGTYSVQISVKTTGEIQKTYPAYIMIRGKHYGDENSFIKKDASGNYLARISNLHSLSQSDIWYTFTGSFKVLDSDLKRDNGTFNFCIDGIPTGSSIRVYFDEVKIVKLCNTSITNSDFSDGLTGWRAWESQTNGRLSTVMEADGNFWGRFLRVSTYASIACNIDQILSYYGGGEYTLSFDIKMEESAFPDQPLTFYFTSNFSEYHQWIGQRVISPDEGVVHLSYTVNVNMYNLNPDTKEVHFRIQAPGNVGRTTYQIDNVRLAPTKIESASVSITMRDRESNVSVLTNGATLDETNTREVFFNMGSYPFNAPKRFDYTVSRPNVLKISPDGIIRVCGAGTVTVTATSRTGNISFTQTINVKGGELYGFVGYGQERAGQCWAAAARTLSAWQARKLGIDNPVDTSISLADDIISIGLPAGKPQSYEEALKLCKKYLRSKMPKDYVYEQREFSDPPVLTEQEIGNLISNDTLIYAVGRNRADVKGHIYVIYGFYYSGSTMYLRAYDSAANGNKGAHKEMSYNYFNNENEYLWKGAFYFEG